MTTFTREPQGLGVLVTKTGSTGSVVIELHDAAGNIVQQRTDADGDGMFERVVEVTFNASGYKVMSAVDADCDGTVDERRSYDNDVCGNVLLEAVDADGDGAIDFEMTYDYACWAA